LRFRYDAVVWIDHSESRIEARGSRAPRAVEVAGLAVVALAVLIVRYGRLRCPNEPIKPFDGGGGRGENVWPSSAATA